MLICTRIKSNRYDILDTDDYTIQDIGLNDFTHLLKHRLIANMESDGKPQWIISLVTGEICDIYMRNKWLVLQYRETTLTAEHRCMWVWYKNKSVTVFNMTDSRHIKDVLLSPFSDKIIEIITEDENAGRYALLSGLTDASRYFAEFEDGEVRALECPFSRNPNYTQGSHVKYEQDKWYCSVHLPIRVERDTSTGVEQYRIQYNNQERVYHYRATLELNLVNVIAVPLLHKYKDIVTKYKKYLYKCTKEHFTYVIDYYLLKERGDLAYRLGLLDVYSEISTNEDKSAVYLTLRAISIEEDGRTIILGEITC